MVAVTRTRKTINQNYGNSANSGLEEKLWAAADKLRGQMDAAEYKHVVLGLIFLKYISDSFEEHYHQLELWSANPSNSFYIKEQQGRYKILEDKGQYLARNLFWVPKEARWSYVQKNSKNLNIGKIIDSAMFLIEQENPSLKNILPKDYSRLSLDQRRLGELVELIGTIGFGDTESCSKDILGMVYEYFLGQFACLEAKGGEFYTPQSIVKLLVEMIQPYKGCVYDPCCGSGGMFVQSEKFVESHGWKAEDLSIYGQESNPTTWRLCKMNLALRRIRGNLGSCHADTFSNDLHPNLKANYILANPPFNMSDWGGEHLRHDSRWQYGIPPTNNANFAWVQHIISHLAQDGIAGFVLSNGSLNHSQGDGKIREALIEADLIDCIVALPIQLFYTTQISACLWFVARNKQETKFRNRKGQTLFIYAYSFGEMVDRTHCTLTDSEISRIARTYQSWRNKESFGNYKDIPGFCKSATLEEIRSHKMSLVPGRYVGFDEELTKRWDMERLRVELADVETRLKEIANASDSAFKVLKELLHG